MFAGVRQHYEYLDLTRVSSGDGTTMCRALLIFPPEEHDMLKCLVNISKTYFPERSTIVVSISEEHPVRVLEREWVLPEIHGDMGCCTSVNGFNTALIQELQFLALLTIIVHDAGNIYVFPIINNENKCNYVLLLESRKDVHGFIK
jgi:hypothetical protein